MENTYTFKREQVEEVFRDLETIHNLYESYKEEGNETQARDYFKEWIGVYCALISLGLTDTYCKWQREQREMKHEAVLEAMKLKAIKEE